ncbi:uncharacterized protein LOC143701662 isoform X2 [Siphateles boraxobius]
MLYDRIHRGAFNCSETHFNETVKCPHDDSQHFFNVDYLIIANILTNRLDDFLESQTKGLVPKNSVSVMITPKTFCTEMRLSCIKDKIEEQKPSNPTLYQDFLIVKNLLRDSPETESVGFSIERDKLLDQGCPLTPVLITLALKCFASALVGRLKQKDILVFKQSVILCIQPEDLKKVITAVKSRDNEVYYIKELSKGNVDGKQLKCLENESSKDEDWNKRKKEKLVHYTEEESEASWFKTDKINTERRVCEDRDIWSIKNEKKYILMEGDGRQTMYAVVTFQDSDEVMVVASNWLSPDKTQSHWPPFRSPEKCMEAVQSRLKPETGGKPWEKMNINFHKEYVFFDKAIEGQKEITEQKEQLFLLATGFSGIPKRQSTQDQLPTPSTSRMPADGKNELLQMLRDIRSTVQKNSSMLKKLLKDNTVSEAPSSSTSFPTRDVKTSLNLPLRTFEDVERIERELNSAASRKKYVQYLSRLGGFGAKDVIKNIMKQVLTNDLAKEFNWQGRGDKKPFSQLILTDVIREAASKNSVMRVDCETEIKMYLWYTIDRIGRKRPRVCGGATSEETSPTLLDSAFQSEIGMSFLED